MRISSNGGSGGGRHYSRTAKRAITRPVVHSGYNADNGWAVDVSCPVLTEEPSPHDPHRLPPARHARPGSAPVAPRPGGDPAHDGAARVALAADPRLLRRLPGDAGRGVQAVRPALARGVVPGRALDSPVGRRHPFAHVLGAVPERADQGLAPEAPGPVARRRVRGHADGGRHEPRRGRGDGHRGPGLPPAPRRTAAARRRRGCGPHLPQRGIPARGRHRRRHADSISSAPPSAGSGARASSGGG